MYKAIGKSKSVSDSVGVAILQKIKTGILVRYYNVHKYYCDHYKNPELRILEVGRDFYEGDKVKPYEMRNFKQTGNTRWCEGEGGIYYDYTNVVLYENNLDKELNKTEWKYSQLKQFATHSPGYRFNPYMYLTLYIKYPFIEYLIKFQLFKLVRDFIYNSRYSSIYDTTFNLKGKSFMEILKLNKSYLPILQNSNGGNAELIVLQEASNKNYNITVEELLYITKKLRANICIIDVSNKYKITLHKIIKYINLQENTLSDTQSTIYNNPWQTSVFRDWCDYLQNCELLGRNMTLEFVLFPKKFKEAHDFAFKLVKQHNIELCDKSIKAMNKKLSDMYCWNWGNYCIIIPQSAQDLIDEGDALNHCVGTNYLEPMAKGKTVIVFLRQMDNITKPFYTIEIKNDTILQCRRYNDYNATPAVEKVINKYKLEKLQPLTKNKKMSA